MKGLILLITLYTFFLKHAILVSFLTAFGIGGVGVIFLSAVNHNSPIVLVKIFLSCWAGFVAADSLWFSLGKLKLWSHLKKIWIIEATYMNVEKFMSSVIEKGYFATILLAKIAYGLAIPTLMYYGRRKRDLKAFLRRDIPINGILLSVFVFVGWGLGAGVSFIYDLYANKSLVIGFLFLALMGLYIMKRILEELVERKKRSYKLKKKKI